MDQAIEAISYVMEPSRFARGMTVVRCMSADEFKSPTARLAEEFAGGRFSYREHGYLMSSVAARNFIRAHSLGCRAVGNAIRWESNGGDHAVSFSAKHPRAAFRCIAEMGR